MLTQIDIRNSRYAVLVIEKSKEGGGQSAPFTWPVTEFVEEIERDVTELMKDMIEYGFNGEGEMGRKAAAIRGKIIAWRCLHSESAAAAINSTADRIVSSLFRDGYGVEIGRLVIEAKDPEYGCRGGWCRDGVRDVLVRNLSTFAGLDEGGQL